MLHALSPSALRFVIMQIWIAGGWHEPIANRCSVACTSPGLLVFECCFTEPRLEYLFPGKEVPCGICPILGTMSKHSRSSTNVVGAGDAKLSSICGARTGRKPQFWCARHLIFYMEVVICILPFRLGQFIKHHLLLANPPPALLFHFGACALQLAWCITVALLALRGICILILPIVSIIGTCKITETFSASNHHLL